jgi:CheY-like chemotaxis protein
MTEQQHQPIVLVVDDDDLVREAIANLLRAKGYGVSTCENGRQALELLRGGHWPNLIVLDLLMPHMNGWEFRAAQLRDSAWAQIPVITLSADRSAQAMSIAAEACLAKPIDADQFLSAIEQALEVGGRRQAVAANTELDILRPIGELISQVATPLKLANGTALASLDLAVEQFAASGFRHARLFVERAQRALLGAHKHVSQLLRVERWSEANPDGRARVLIIDDDAPSGELLEALLSPRCEAHLLTSPSIALDVLRRDGCFDLVLCRLWMPALTGVDICQALRKSHPEQAAQFVFLSGDSKQERCELARLRTLPKAKLLRRPIDVEQLYALLDTSQTPPH